MKLSFKPLIDESTRLAVAIGGTSAQDNLVIIRKTSETSPAPPIQQVPHTRIILVGQDTRWALQIALRKHGRPAVNKSLDGAIGAHTYTKLRRWLDLTDN